MGLAHSSDTFFYQLSEKVGLTSLTDWASLYGFGAPTGIDLPNEVSGIVPLISGKRSPRVSRCTQERSQRASGKAMTP